MQDLRHPAPAACRVAGSGAGGGVAVRGPAAGPEPAPGPTAQQNTALYWSFPGSALDVSLSRRWLAAAVEQAWGAGDDADRVVLAYSEIATNAVVHGTGPVTVSARIRSGAVTCEVADCSDRAPQPRAAGGEDVCGRGLDLVVMTVDRFRVDVGETGKTVSFEVGRQFSAAAGSGRSPLPPSAPGPVAAGSESGSVSRSAAESGPESGSEAVSASGPIPGSGSGPGSAGGPAGGATGGQQGTG
ncbi:ATP-binding protein [Catenulispora sp. NL8]|uniref:ATP-binding protein n=1 Tax=Catenulispora pinistramenti TaxID=2705254 RepID=A0ABS5KZY0_9ACTN|nr:ATP-binding protein [Catenulispora pinistramenti]MBS2551460.1 ATP-binding protein [Catenulispora pinistramenti]